MKHITPARPNQIRLVLSRPTTLYVPWEPLSWTQTRSGYYEANHPLKVPSQALCVGVDVRYGYGPATRVPVRVGSYGPATATAHLEWTLDPDEAPKVNWAKRLFGAVRERMNHGRG